MEALNNISTNVPQWLKRLDDLSGQIDQRQLELARLTEAQASASLEGNPSGGPRSIRNKGSTESLKPRDDTEAHPRAPGDEDPEADNAAATAAARAAGAAAALASTEQQAPASPADPQSPSAAQQQQQQMMQARAAGQARVRQTLRKRHRSDSVISVEDDVPKYRTRSMIIVYYDSYVQIFFEELVKFVSASRNMMRKAKMAARVAKIKRLAELEMPLDDDATGNNKPDGAPLTPDPTPDATATPAAAPCEAATTPAGEAPTEAGGPSPSAGAQGNESAAPKYVSSRRMVPTRAGRNMYGRPGGGARGSHGQQPGDVYDELDKGLEYVQSMSEHAAHQFLRDGECADEIANIKRRLAETKELADRELERVRKEGPGDLDLADSFIRGGRSYRPLSMRRDNAAAVAAAKEPPKLEPDPEPEKLEVDEAVGDVEVDVEAELPKLIYKSTRMMR